VRQEGFEHRSTAPLPRRWHFVDASPVTARWTVEPDWATELIRAPAGKGQAGKAMMVSRHLRWSAILQFAK